jgi:3-dehydroquinate dehydratase
VRVVGRRRSRERDRARRDGARARARADQHRVAPRLLALERLFAACEAAGADVPKLATRVSTEADRDALFALLAPRAGRVCVIGMGAPELRLDLPARGSRLAYGYIDVSTAPGQLSAAEMDERLAEASPAYAATRAARVTRA